MTDIIILGSTGSIGRSALRVVESFPERFRIKGLSCKGSLPLLREQIERYRPQFVAVSSAEACGSDAYRALKKEFASLGESMGVSVSVMHERVFSAMHRI